MASLRMVTVSLAVELCVLCGTISAALPKGLACNDVLRKLSECKVFLEGSETETTPSRLCCWGVHDVILSAISPENRRYLCVCFKVYALTHKVLLHRAKNLAALCHQTVPRPFDPSVDCGK